MIRAVNVESSADENSPDASQLGTPPNVQLNFGCFNAGISQDMLPKDVHQKNLGRVIGKAVDEQSLHMVALCEVGAISKDWRRAR